MSTQPTLLGLPEPPNPTPALVAACQALCFAYARGEERCGSIDWDDIDYAFSLARDALAQAGEPIPEPRELDDEDEDEEDA